MERERHTLTKECQANTLHLDGMVFKTSGNIQFHDHEENPFFLANSPVLEKMDCFLEHGMQMLMKKISC